MPGTGGAGALGFYGKWWALQRADEAYWKERAAKFAARLRGRPAEERVQALDDEICRLQLVVRALMDVLGNNRQVTKAQFSEALRRIDLEDGVEDGRVTKKRPQAESPPAAPTPRRRR